MMHRTHRVVRAITLGVLPLFANLVVSQGCYQSEESGESVELAIVGPDGAGHAGLLRVDGDQIELEIDGQTIRTEMVQPDAIQVGPEAFEVQTAEGSVLVEAIDDATAAVTLDNGDQMRVSFPEGLPQGSPDGVGVNHQALCELVTCIIAIGMVGFILVAVCGAMAIQTCGWRGIDYWYVASWNHGFCSVKCR